MRYLRYTWYPALLVVWLLRELVGYISVYWVPLDDVMGPFADTFWSRRWWQMERGCWWIKDRLYPADVQYIDAEFTVE